MLCLHHAWFPLRLKDDEWRVEPRELRGRSHRRRFRFSSRWRFRIERKDTRTDSRWVTRVGGAGEWVSLDDTDRSRARTH